ncbi:SDR family NAD(P)-dependent oxidoreductase [Xanthovirga aplysinae]|uniref:SDR family NAD(P)-dependent oxidoreductase n=1 Tax=Xanthovirga aplysinae TaxID=2529853 RepID=UPI0012BCE9A3|nr:SDR family NAD(P)-dependent oxidoreductase [Xanthovirga aplysinae]MTI32430.1 SDR family NAD(P)-dependent oxidoreductase [Xanthovirga aplysinae]
MSYALITGASKGIGKALVHEFASRGYSILAIARSERLLKDLVITIENRYPVTAKYLAIDLTEEGAVKKVVEWSQTETKELKVLVNNAGYGMWGHFNQMNFEMQENMMQLNMHSLVALSYAFLPQLLKQPKAFILNVSSLTAYQAVPTLNIYAATKAFVLLFSRGLSRELKGSSVFVCCLSPGATQTEFLKRAGMGSMEGMAKIVSMTPEKVAKIAVNGMFNWKKEIIPGFMNLLSIKLLKLLPKGVSERIMEFVSSYSK